MVNAAVLVTTLTGGAARGRSCISGMRSHDGEETFPRGWWCHYCEYSRQAVTGALLLGVAGASLPAAGAIAFGAGCVSGITAGALSEWGVDHALGDEEGEGKDTVRDETNRLEASALTRWKRSSECKVIIVQFFDKRIEITCYP